MAGLLPLADAPGKWRLVADASVASARRRCDEQHQLARISLAAVATMVHVAKAA